MTCCWALEYVPGNRLRMGELVEQLVLSPSGLTRLVDRIEKGGFGRAASVLQRPARL